VKAEDDGTADVKGEGEVEITGVTELTSAEKKESKRARTPEPLQRTYDEFLASQTVLDDDTKKTRRPVQNDESQFKTAKVKAKAEEKNAYVAAASSEQELR